jgi:DNA-binding transcriptional regulator YdaS (Cro superfamily)
MGSVNMTLAAFIADRDRRISLAKAVSASPNYLWQVATGWNGRKPSPKLARRIHEATHGLVTMQSMRPDVFGPAANDS